MRGSGGWSTLTLVTDPLGPPAYGPSGYPPPGYPPPGYPGFPGGPGYWPGPGGAPPSSNIGWAIAALFTFWPLAIPAFIFSSRVEPSWYRGDVVGARKASEDARRYGVIGVIVGGAFIVVAVIVWIVLITVFVGAVHHIHDYPTFVPYTPQPVPS